MGCNKSVLNTPGKHLNIHQFLSQGEAILSSMGHICATQWCGDLRFLQKSCQCIMERQILFSKPELLSLSGMSVCCRHTYKTLSMQIYSNLYLNTSWEGLPYFLLRISLVVEGLKIMCHLWRINSCGYIWISLSMNTSASDLRKALFDFFKETILVS